MINQIESLVHLATAYLGAETGSEAHRRLVDFYNEIRPLPRSYRLKYTDAWCAAFVSACGYMLGIPQTVIRPECGAQEMFKAYPASQRVYGEADRGDLVFYDWNGDGRIDHVGIVVFSGSGQLQVIEGNKDAAVSYRFIRAEDPAVYAFIRPLYETADIRLLYVDCDELNVRSGPSMDAEILRTLSYASLVTGDLELDGWEHIDDGSGEGWAGAGYLSEEQPPLTGVTTTAVNLRESAGTEARILKVLPAGTQLRYTGDRELIGSAVWERVVVTDTLQGWLNRKYTRPDDEPLS